jgi:hypothetical protein
MCSLRGGGEQRYCMAMRAESSSTRATGAQPSRRAGACARTREQVSEPTYAVFRAPELTELARQTSLEKLVLGVHEAA